MPQLTVFVLLSAFFAYSSRKALLRPHSHGFYRFFAWECILVLVLLNVRHWFENPLSARQFFSTLFLFVSLYLVAYGVYLLRTVGKPDPGRADDELYSFEKTTFLVTVGIYRYIRHPLYSSLLFFTWGIFLKNISWNALLLAISSSFFLLLTAWKDESECLRHFGKVYKHYMQGTKKFVPYLF